MAEITNTGAANRIKVSNSGAKYYSDLAQQYYNQAKEVAELALQGKVELEQQMQETVAIKEALEEQFINFKRYVDRIDLEHLVYWWNCDASSYSAIAGEFICKNLFHDMPNLKKVYIPADVSGIQAKYVTDSPFYGVRQDCVILTGIESEDNIPPTWGEYWNYRTDAEKTATIYGATLEDFENYSASEE